MLIDKLWLCWGSHQHTINQQWVKVVNDVSMPPHSYHTGCGALVRRPVADRTSNIGGDNSGLSCLLMSCGALAARHEPPCAAHAAWRNATTATHAARPTHQP